MRSVIPDRALLVRDVMDAATHRDSMLHGPAHWRCVAWTGWQLSQKTAGADRAVVFLFGLFHDAMRLNDGADPRHGDRAAELVRRLNGTCFHLDAARLKTLCFACEQHTHGRLSSDATVGVCWDADRLNLWRLGIRPEPKFLSTEYARASEMIQIAGQLEGQHKDWGTIYDAFAGASKASAPGSP